DAWDLVAGVEGIPLSAQVSLKPRAEIHRAGRYRHADVAQIAGAISSRDVQAAAEGDRQVHVIAADACPLSINPQGRSIGLRLRIIEADMLANEVADRFDSGPTGSGSTKERPGDVLQLAVHLAIAAGQQKQEDFLRQVLHVELRRVPH